MLTDKKFFLWINLFFAFLVVFGAFLVFPPSGNFGDQPSQNVHFQGKLVEYNESDFQGTFTDYYKDAWRNYHKETLELNDAHAIQTKYGLDTRISGITHAERVKALARLSELAVFYAAFKQIDMETAFIISSLIILLATYFFSFKFGEEIADSFYGTILAVVVTSNVYFNQLTRSAMQNECLLYPLLFCMSFYYLLRLHNAKNGEKAVCILGLGITLGFCVVNGYPNTTLVIIPSLIFAAIVLCINNYLGNKKYRRASCVNYILVLLAASFFTTLLSIIWSKLLGESLFYHLSMITTRWDRISMVSSFANATFFVNKTFATFTATFKSVFNLLLHGGSVYNAPHEPGLQFKQGFFNIFENLFLFTGLFVFATRFFKNKTLNLFLIYIIAVFIARTLSNLNVGLDKSNYDCYFLLQFVVSYGLWFLVTSDFVIQKAVKMFDFFQQLMKSKYLNAPEHSRFMKKLFLCIGIMTILPINMYHFNSNFVYSQNESLGYHRGLYELRQFVKNEVTKEKNNLLIIDWRWSDIFNTDLITFLNGGFKLDVLSNFKNLFDTPEKLYTALENGTYSSIYIVVPGPVATISGRHQLGGGRNRYNMIPDVYQYLNPANHYLTIRDQQGKPTYYIHKITNESRYVTKKVNQKPNSVDTISLDIKPGNYLEYIDFPGNVIKAELVCKDQRILIDLSKTTYDYFFLSFDKKSKLEIYNTFNPENKSILSTNRMIHKLYKTYLSSLLPQGGEASIDFKYEFDFPIQNILLHIPYLLYNDRQRINKIQVQWKNNENENWNTFRGIGSNGNGLFGLWQWDPPADPLEVVSENAFIDSFAGVLSGNSSGKLFLRYYARTRTYGFNYGTRFLTYNSTVPENNSNFLIFELDTSKFADFSRNCMGKVCINLFYGEPKNLSPSQSFIGVGVRQLANK